VSNSGQWPHSFFKAPQKEYCYNWPVSKFTFFCDGPLRLVHTLQTKITCQVLIDLGFPFLSHFLKFAPKYCPTQRSSSILGNFRDKIRTNQGYISPYIIQCGTHKLSQISPKMEKKIGKICPQILAWCIPDPKAKVAQPYRAKGGQNYWPKTIKKPSSSNDSEMFFLPKSRLKIVHICTVLLSIKKNKNL